MIKNKVVETKFEKEITYFGQTAKVACDGKCNKAWGFVCRPRIYPSIDNVIFGLDESSIYPDQNKYPNFTDDDFDDYAWLSDDELGDAPIDPGTYEGEYGKPDSNLEFPNKWCVRQCERCVMSDKGKFNEPLILKDFSKRLYNKN
jgi:hypothetical protein